MTEVLDQLSPKKRSKFLLKKRIEEAQNYKSDKKNMFTMSSKIKQIAKKFKSKEDIMLPINQTINDYNLTRQETTTESADYEIIGPQLKLDKKFLSFIVKRGQVCTESIDVYNNGSTAIYYEWVKVQKNFLFSQSLKDNEERFYCHHKKNVIKPGEKISFKFSFLSKVSGIFDEEWILNCEPHTLEPIPVIKFTGQAIIEDLYIEWRNDLKFSLEKSYINKNISEIVNDIVDSVRTPTPPLPDLENKEVCEYEFEMKNHSKNLWYTDITMALLRHLELELCKEHGIDPEERYWDLNIDHVVNMIRDIKDDEIRAEYERKYIDLLQLLRFRPFHKSPIFYYLKELMTSLLNNMPEISTNARKELDMWEYNFKEPTNIPLTEDEIKKKTEEEAKIKAEWLKKSKKKKFTEEDEKKLIDDYKLKFMQKSSQFYLDKLNLFEDNEDYIEILHELDRKKRPDIAYFESLGKKKFLKDFDLEGKRVMIRANLKLGETPEAIIKKEEHESNIIHAEEIRRAELERLEKERIDEEKRRKRGRGIVKKKNKGDDPALKLIDVQKKLLEEKKKEVPFLDEENVKDIIDTIKYCLEHSAKLVILLLSYDKPTAQYNQIFSVKFFEEYLKRLIEQKVFFNENIIIPDFIEKIEADEFPENSVLILENVYFQPEEIGFSKTIEGNMLKLTFDEKQQYINILSEYTSIYVIEDKPDLFKKWTSLSNFKPESCVMGIKTSKDIQILSYSIINEKQPFLAIIGGDLTAHKLLSIDSLLNLADEIWLLGKIGMYFRMYNEKIDKFCDLKLDNFTKKLIDKIYKNIAHLNLIKSMPKSPNPNMKIAKICFPCDLYYTEFRDIKDENFSTFEVNSKEWIEIVNSNKKYLCFLNEEEVKNFENNELELIRKEEEEKMKELKKKELKEKGSRSGSGYIDEEDLMFDSIEKKKIEVENMPNSLKPSLRDVLNPIKDEIKDSNKDIFSKQDIKPIVEEKKTNEKNEKIDKINKEDKNKKDDGKTHKEDKNKKAVIEEEVDPNDITRKGLFLVDYAYITLRKLFRSIKNSKKLLWVDRLGPNNIDGFNESNSYIAKNLYEIQENKKNNIQKDLNNGSHDYKNDLMVFTFGKELDKLINFIDIIDPALLQQLQKEEDAEEEGNKTLDTKSLAEKNNNLEDGKSQISGKTNEKFIKNNMPLISDFCGEDSDFALKILSGKHLSGLVLVNEWEIKANSDAEENNSFLDEI